MIRVVQLVSTREMGGVDVLTAMVASGLAARDISITTLSLGGELAGSARYLVLARTVWTLLRSPPDAVFTYHAAASVLGCTLGALTGVKLRAAHQTAVPAAIRPIWRRLDRWLGSIGVYTEIIANSAATMAAFDGYPSVYRRHLRLLPHGVEPVRATVEMS